MYVVPSTVYMERKKAITDIFFEKGNFLFINSLLIILFLTNLSIFLYNHLLDSLTYFFPLVDPFSHDPNFLVTGALPEPYEIPVYLGVVFILTVIAVSFYRLGIYNRFFSVLHRTRQIVKWLMAIFLILLFVDYLGDFPYAFDIYPYIINLGQSAYLKYWWLYLFSVILIMSGIWTVVNLLRRFSNDKVVKSAIYFLVFIISLIITFEPKFPISGHDYSFLYGPIYEIATGKTIFTQVISQYGFFSVLIFASLYKLNLFTFLTLPIVIWIFYTTEYFIFFKIIYDESKSVILGLLAFFSVITVNFFCGYYIPSWQPQIGPMRWLPIFLLIYFIQKNKDITSRMIMALTGFLIFWVVDVGLYLILIYSFSVFILLISGQISLGKTIKTGILTALYTLSIFMIINVFQFLVSRQFINPLHIFVKVNQYARSGYGMLPMVDKSYFWLVLFAFFTALFTFLFIKRDRSYLSWILVSGISSFITGVYFVGRSHQYNIFILAPFFLLTIFGVLALMWQKTNINIHKIIIVIIFVLLIAFPSYVRKEQISGLLINRSSRYLNQSFRMEADDWMDKHNSAVNLINQEITSKEILLLHPDDTYFFYKLKKRNFLDANPQATIIDAKSAVLSMIRVQKECPEKIAINCYMAGKCEGTSYYFLDDGRNKSLQPKVFEELQKYCGGVYITDKCSGTMCIAVLDKK